MEPPPKTLLQRRRATIGLMIIAATLTLLAAQHFWWSRPTAFGGLRHDRAYGTEAVGTTYTVNMLGPGAGETVTLRAVEPIIRKNTADADVSFVVCVARDPDALLGAGTESLEPYCSDLRPVAGQVLRGDSRALVVYMRVTPRRAGTVRIDGMRVSYRRQGVQHLWQTGTESAGVGLTATAPTG